MVAALVIITILFFVILNLLLKREDREEKISFRQKQNPIFLSPEKALLPVGGEKSRYFHLSHSWVLPAKEYEAYLGFDKFISKLFNFDVRIQSLPRVGSSITQGSKIWDVKINGHKISQLSPVTGEVVEVNAACNAGLPLASNDVEKSWILKIKPSNIENEKKNLMNFQQASMMNNALMDDFLAFAQHEHCLNDGGQIEPSYMKSMPEENWKIFIQKFFPHVNENHHNQL
ncbi:MAG: hypothetical protein KJ799_07300 [Bacteroidetes bacterium]|nr:hypothetical protein [Bacteroidota bacterium]MBU1677839.1 hypothetical protein [Bacteroidota bacterium]MBU2506514.1 hypothetical protein [Bacteroidota bacterium]